METVLNQNTDDPEEMYKIAVTLCEMGEHRKVNQLLKNCCNTSPMTLMFCIIWPCPVLI